MLKRQVVCGALLALCAAAGHPVTAETITVRVQDNFFTPQDITIDVGDTVEWRNVTGNGHNVVSCFPEQFGCDGQTADMTFNSGPASTFFSYSFTFTEPGYNPYICQPHAPFMIGSVTVVAPTPPAVPDGGADAPMTVVPVSADASWLRITWSTAGCAGADGYHIVYGGGAGLPALPGGPFQILGAECALAGSPYTWTSTPDPATDPRGLIWWLVLANDAVDTEGSWGTDGQGQERLGPAPDGASGLCGMVQKDVGNTCGQ